MPTELGGGGGRAGDDLANDFYALDKPYELQGDMTAEKLAQIDEMLQALYRALTRAETDIRTLTARVNALTSAGVFKQDVSLSATQVKSLSTVPVSAVSGVPGFIIVPVFWALFEIRGGTDTFDGTPTFTPRLSGIAVDLLRGISMIAGATAGTTRFSLAADLGGAATSTTDGATVAGVDLMLRSNADIASVIGTGSDCAWHFRIVYYLHEVK